MTSTDLTLVSVIAAGFVISLLACLNEIFQRITPKTQNLQRSAAQAVECLRAMLVLIDTDVLVRQDAAYAWQLANLAKTLSDAKQIIGIYDGAPK